MSFKTAIAAESTNRYRTYRVTFVAIGAAVVLFARFAWTTPSQPDRATAVRLQRELHEVVLTSTACQTRPTRTATVVYTAHGRSLVNVSLQVRSRVSDRAIPDADHNSYSCHLNIPRSECRGQSTNDVFIDAGRIRWNENRRIYRNRFISARPSRKAIWMGWDRR